MRYLVTGGAGFIGSHLVDALVEQRKSVLVLDDFSTGSHDNIAHLLESELVEVVEGSVLDEALVDECVRSVECCVHLASAVGVNLIMEHPLESPAKQRPRRGSRNIGSGSSRSESCCSARPRRSTARPAAATSLSTTTC